MMFYIAALTGLACFYQGYLVLVAEWHRDFMKIKHQRMIFDLQNFIYEQ